MNSVPAANTNQSRARLCVPASGCTHGLVVQGVIGRELYKRGILCGRHAGDARVARFNKYTEK
jgi:hypothetical protein